MLNAARVQGRPMMVIAITTAAITQPTAIHRPPQTIHSRFRSTDMGDIPGVPRDSFSISGIHPASLSASRSGGLNRLLQHELALLLYQGFCPVGQHREQPRELHLKPDVVLGDIHSPGRTLPKEACAKIEMVARPLVFEHEQACAA